MAARWPNLTLATEDLSYAPTLNTRALQRLPLLLDG
ncbi:cytochrome P450 [Candidatus Entotheonella palauensis]|nr:cytochrome P450 [Candidatus Entotheonella palauensis]